MILFETWFVFYSVKWYALVEQERNLASGVMVCLTVKFAN